MVVDHTGYDGTHSMSARNMRVIGTNMSCQVRGPRGHSGKQGKSGTAEDDWERQCDGDSIKTGGTVCWMDGATSSTGQCKHSKTDCTRAIHTTPQCLYFICWDKYLH